MKGQDKTMSKVALCLYGVAGHGSTMRFRSAETSHGYLAGIESIKKNIIEANGGSDCVDVFIHSWNPELQEEMQEAYSTKSILCEDPIYPNFKHSIPTNMADNIRVQRMFSRWYSQKYSNVLKEDYETKNGVKYDWVISSRFDIQYRKPFNLKELDNTKFYTSFWKVSCGHNDCYHFSNSETMNKFNYLYDYLNEYYKPDSELIRCFESGEHWSSTSTQVVSNHIVSKWHLDVTMNHRIYHEFFGKENIDFKVVT